MICNYSTATNEILNKSFRIWQKTYHSRHFRCLRKIDSKQSPDRMQDLLLTSKLLLLWRRSHISSNILHVNLTGPEQWPEQGNDRFLYYTMHCTHYTGTGTGTGNHCFLLYLSRSLSMSWSRSRTICMSHYTCFEPNDLANLFRSSRAT